MTRFLFWNYRSGVEPEARLAGLVHHLAADIVILTEHRLDRSRLLSLLNSSGRTFHSIPDPHPTIDLFLAVPRESVLDWNRDQPRLCFRKLRLPSKREILLACVHLEGGLYAERGERKDRAAPVARTIRQEQAALGHTRTLVVGDFNMNPWDDGMISPEGFGAVINRGVLRKLGRSDAHQGWHRFYNPMWSRLGQEPEHGAPGTYYWRSTRPLNPYWNYPDQVLVGHDLLDAFPEAPFRIVTSIPAPDGEQSLLRERPLHWGFPHSDHLPLVFDLDLPDAGEGP